MDALADRMASLPGELDDASERLVRGRLRRMFSNLECYYNIIAANEERIRESYSFEKELGYTLLDPRFGEQMSRLKEPVDVRIVIGNRVVTALAISCLARESGMSTHGVVHKLRRQGYIVLGWDKYQKLLDEICKLIGEHEEEGKITYLTRPVAIGLPVSTTDSAKEQKALPKNSSL
jgi:hypothetical protein